MTRFLNQLGLMVEVDRQGVIADMMKILREQGVIVKINAVQPVPIRDIEHLAADKDLARERAAMFLGQLMQKDELLQFRESEDGFAPNTMDIIASVEIIKEPK